MVAILILFNIVYSASHFHSPFSISFLFKYGVRLLLFIHQRVIGFNVECLTVDFVRIPYKFGRQRRT